MVTVEATLPHNSSPLPLAEEVSCYTGQTCPHRSPYRLALILSCLQTQTCQVPETLYALFPRLPKICKMLPVYRTPGLAKSSALLTLI